MFELTIHRPGQPERKVHLKGGVYSLGRHEENDIVLDDLEVSRRHARIVVDGETAVVEDLGSGNGTFVDGAPVTLRGLRDGDEIEILPFTMRVRRGSAPVLPPRKVLSLQVVEGANVGARFPLTGEAMGVGRGEDQAVRLDDQGASSSHALLVLRRGTWFVRDLDSTNGVFVNEQRVAEAPLEVGDDVAIGNSVLRLVELVEASDVDAVDELDDDPTDVGASPASVAVAPAPSAPAPAQFAPPPLQVAQGVQAPPPVVETASASSSRSTTLAIVGLGLLVVIVAAAALALNAG